MSNVQSFKMSVIKSKTDESRFRRFKADSLRRYEAFNLADVDSPERKYVDTGKVSKAQILAEITRLKEVVKSMQSSNPKKAKKTDQQNLRRASA